MSARKASAKQQRAKALDLWQAPAQAGEPLVCLATSFTFDAAFFEKECLGRFLQMDTDPDEDAAISYLIEREEKLAASRVAVMIDRRHAQSKASMRWDVLPVIVPRAAQHAKVTVLCWAGCVRVIVGSGNLTEPGYRKNLEVFGTLEATRNEGGAVDETLAVIDFLEQVAYRALGDSTHSGPKRRVAESLALLRQHIQDWPRRVNRNVQVKPIFGGIGNSVFEQLSHMLPGGPARNVDVVSPFFDRSLDDDESGSNNRRTTTVETLLAAMAKRRPRQVNFYVPYEDSPDGRVRLFAPRAMVDEALRAADLRVCKIKLVQDGEPRPLHAKLMVFANEGWEAWMIGSSNFTRAGCSVNAMAANLEANLAYIVRRNATESRTLRQVLPELEDDEVDLNSDAIVWEAAFDTAGEGAGIAMLPTGFREALFDTGSQPPCLRLSFGDNLPADWRITVGAGQALLGSDDWNGVSEIRLEWMESYTPFLLGVAWTTESGSYAADWPVNVVSPATLPPPEALRHLALEDLIEILSSTRPLHIAIAQALKRRTQRRADDLQLDPHKRVDTREYLLRRTKRVALALERLRERLERPVLNADALDWRLRGPVGALALAESFGKEARTADEAQFFLAELGLTLGRVRAARAAAGTLSASGIRKRIREIIEEIEQFTRQLAPAESAAIARYVKEAFEEALA